MNQRRLAKRVYERTVGRLDLKNNLLILPALGYSLGLSLYYALYGIEVDYLPALCFLAAVLTMVVLGSRRKMDRYWVSIISIMVSYEALQGMAGTLATSRNVLSLYSIDRLIWGFNVTGYVQSAFASPAVTFLSTVFYSMHVPLVVATCLVVWYAKRPMFGKYVTVMVLTTYAALATFILLPTAPPWYSGVASNIYTSAVASSLPHGVTSLISMVEIDQFAAFPSLHGAYAIIFSYFMIKVDRRLALISVPITVGILFSTLYLGQHYLIDLIGGAAYALVPCLIAERFQIRLPGTSAPSDGSR